MSGREVPEMRQVCKRLKNKAGESLIESLIAILIFTFGSIIMLSMITSAMKVNEATKKADEKYFSDTLAVEKAVTPTVENQTVSFCLIDHASGLSGGTSVQVYGNSDGLYAYYIAEGGG